MISRRLVLSAGLLAIPSVAFAEERWVTYRNTRYGTSIEYPSRFVLGRPPDNNDGQSFSADDGATLRVWGSLNTNAYDLAKLEADMREGQAVNEIVSGSDRGANWFAFTGRRGSDQLFYRRYLLSHHELVINAFDIGYPEASRATYDPIVARIARSLHPGRGYQIQRAP